MSNKNNVVDRINQDLKMKPLNAENTIDHITRIIYSATSLKIRSDVLDIEVVDGFVFDNGRSQKKVVQLSSAFLDYMIGQYPEMNIWFKGNEEKSPATIIINRLKAFGDLQLVGFNSHLMLPDEELFQVKKGLYHVRGLCDEKNVSMSGLVPLQLGNTKDEVKVRDIRAFFNGVKKADETWKAYIENIKWQKIDMERMSYEVFDPYNKSFFANAWCEISRLPHNETTIYKDEYGHFGFVKFSKGKCFVSEISKFLIDNYEVNRFLLGLKARCNNHAKAHYQYDSDYVTLHLECNLPTKELSLLYLYGWPVRHIQDRYHFIFHESIWDLIYEVLENLCIEVVGD